MTRRTAVKYLTVCMPVLLLGGSIAQQPHADRAGGRWHIASSSELRKVIPLRAPVVDERIETEFRTASGIQDDHGHLIAGVVLITAGYAAEGKYSHYLVLQVPLVIGTMSLDAGEYVFGWTRSNDSLSVKFYEASTGKLLGEVEAKRDDSIHRVESFRVLPPSERQGFQLGRFTFPYSLR